MARLLARDLIRQGVSTSRALMSHQDKIWSRYSRDKVDIGETLARVLRTLSKALPLELPLRALSVGSSTEPQFRILEASFRGGLYLLDIERAALAVINERIRRQALTHVFTLRDNYTEIFADRDRTRRSPGALGGRRLHLVRLRALALLLPADRWRQLLDNVFDGARGAGGRRAPRDDVGERATDPSTTTWLYNHFAGKFFGHRNDQDLAAFARDAARGRWFKGAKILTKKDRVRFFVDDFRALMSVVWMILLYPNVHRTRRRSGERSPRTSTGISSRRRKPLLQDQDHLVIYRGVGKGLI